jgi:hypothetical protein
MHHIEISETIIFFIRGETKQGDEGAWRFIIFGKWHIQIDIDNNNGAYLPVESRLNTSAEPRLVIIRHRFDMNTELGLFSLEKHMRHMLPGTRSYLLDQRRTFFTTEL